MNKRSSSLRSKRLVAPLAAVALVASGCSSDDNAMDKETAKSVVETYANGVKAMYETSLTSAKKMDSAIDAFAASPDEKTLADAKNAWLSARDDYGKTEAFRFYEGPIDHEENGKEGLINAWPLDEAYIDYVEGKANAGIINDPAKYPNINADVITELNEKDGEANISTGWHAIEFLLWGQDLSEIGPGARPVTDYTTAPNADRRKAYLTTTSDLLITHLEELVQAWDPNVSNNYRAEFVSADPKEAIRRIITGVGELSRGELAGERMNVAFMEHSQEDEHSCFSDNTTADIVANAEGIRMVITGQYGSGTSGASIAELVAKKDKALSDKLVSEVTKSVEDAKSIPAPFDKNLRPGLSDDDPGRVAVARTMKSLETQTDTIVAAAKAIGVTIQVS